MLDLKALASKKQVQTLQSNGQFKAGGHTFATTESGSFISDPATVDLDIGSNRNASARFKADVVYYGTIAGDMTQPRGTMYRLITKNQGQTVVEL